MDDDNMDQWQYSTNYFKTMDNFYDLNRQSPSIKMCNDIDSRS